jgi:hypothetical protein
VRCPMTSGTIIKARRATSARPHARGCFGIVTARGHDRPIERDLLALCASAEPVLLNAPPEFVGCSGGVHRRICALARLSELVVRPGDCGNFARKASR